MNNEEMNNQNEWPADSPLPPEGNDRNEPPLDEASLSISNALQTSFLALKFVLLGLVVIYLGSGYFTLQAGQKAVVVQFGQIQGTGSAEGPVLAEGAHWSWPWPVSEKIVEDTEKTRTLSLDSFWFFLDPQLRGLTIDQILAKASPPEKLHPGIDGYLLTGEQEIVHLKCEVRYKIDDMVKYVTNVNDDPREVSRPMEPPLIIPGHIYLLQTIAEWAASQTVAQMPTDEVVRGDDGLLRGQMKMLMQRRLDELDSGLGIIDVLINWRSVPLQVRPGYLAVVQAENKKAEAIANARRDATQKLNEAAGPTHEQLGIAMREYETARTLGNSEQADVRMREIMQLLERAGGRVAHAVESAKAEASRRNQQIQAEVNRFRKAYPQYIRNPAVFMAQYWADTKQQILASPMVERIYLPRGSKEIRLNLGHNPNFSKQLEIDRYNEQAGQ